ncbi:hypothetical protein [Luteimonas mephitis]|uniref:hypothetical protein n=1 Tax=Luteimonas mephitis TaxID=83615 RepID=UPI00047A2DF0|nr:hypothetical protein [Luteimonas mephitis]
MLIQLSDYFFTPTGIAGFSGVREAGHDEVIEVLLVGGQTVNVRFKHGTGQAAFDFLCAAVGDAQSAE